MQNITILSAFGTKYSITVLLILILSTCLIHQADARTNPDSLLHMRLIDRSMNMYRGQLQFNAGYGLHVTTRYYSPEGEPFNLKEEGRTVLNHNYRFDMLYGLSDYIEISLKTKFVSITEGLRSVTKLGTDNFAIYKGNIETRGLEDMDLGLAFLLPFLPDFLDASVNAGLSLPLSGNNPEQPDHVITFPSELYPESHVINYRYLNKPGEGVVFVDYGGKIKIRTSSMAFTGRIKYSFPTAEGNSYLWHSRFKGTEIEYQKEQFSYLPRGYLNYSFSGLYQVFPWFAAELSLTGMKGEGGWKESMGRKYTVPEIGYLYAGAALEVMATGRLRIYQSFSLPVSGSNVNCGLLINTSMNFNLFPFQNR
jgi:hypothetical protein